MSLKSSLYLYNTDIKLLIKEPYEVVLLKKIHASKVLMGILVREENMNDNRRMVAVSKAITFNTELLLEVGYDYPTISKKLKELYE